MGRLSAAKAKKMFERHWVEGINRIGLARIEGMTPIEVIETFEEYREPIRPDGIIYEHEFEGMAGKPLNSDGDTKTSEPFYCYGFMSMAIMISLRKIGTPSAAYMQIELELAPMNKTEWYSLKDGQIGWLFESEYNLPTDISYTAPVMAPFIRAKVTAHGSNLDSDNHFIINYFKGMFR